MRYGSAANELMLTRAGRIHGTHRCVVALMIVGDIIAYLVGSVVERMAPTASLAVFLGMYFFLLWLAWIIAVKVTEPKPRVRNRG